MVHQKFKYDLGGEFHTLEYVAEKIILDIPLSMNQEINTLLKKVTSNIQPINKCIGYEMYLCTGIGDVPY